MTGSESSPDDGAFSEDAFLDGRLIIHQPLKGHRAGLDAVFLAAAVAAPASGPLTVLEAGAGSGVVSLAIARRISSATVTGVEIEPELVGLATANAARNGLAARARFVVADVTAPRARLSPLGLVPESFDQVVANPPYLEAGDGRISPHRLRQRAIAMPAEHLEHWARFLAMMARPGGVLTLVHRADALGRLLSVLDGRFGRLRVLPLYPRMDAPASRVLIAGVKGSRATMSLHRGMVLHGADGAPTPEAVAVLRHGAAIAWDR
jgi:tRNA1(Val) A37 N6-methylase TrmN6